MNKFKEVSTTVWVCLKAMITEKTLKEECTNKNYSNDNYRLHFADVAYLQVFLSLNFLRPRPFPNLNNIAPLVPIFLNLRTNAMHCV